MHKTMLRRALAFTIATTLALAALPSQAAAQAGGTPSAAPQSTTGVRLGDSVKVTFDDGTDTYTGETKTGTDAAGNEWHLIEVTMPDGTIRQYLWAEESGTYEYGALPVKTLKFWKCPSCGKDNFERSDGPDGEYTTS